MSETSEKHISYTKYMEKRRQHQEDIIERAEALRALQAERVRHRREVNRMQREEQLARWTHKLERAQEHSKIRIFPDLVAAASMDSQRRSRESSTHTFKGRAKSEVSASAAEENQTGPRILFKKGESVIIARPIQDSCEASSARQDRSIQGTLSGVGSAITEYEEGNAYTESQHSSKSSHRKQILFSSRSARHSDSGRPQSIYDSAGDEWGSPLTTFSELRREYMTQNPRLKISSLTPSIDNRLTFNSSSNINDVKTVEEDNLSFYEGNLSSPSQRINQRTHRWYPVNPTSAKEQLAAGWQALPLFSGCPYEDGNRIQRIWRKHNKEAQGNRPPWGAGTISEAKKRIERPSYLYTKQSFSSTNI